MNKVKRSLSVIACVSVCAAALTAYGITTQAKDSAPVDPVPVKTVDAEGTDAAVEAAATPTVKTVNRSTLKVDLISAEEAPPESYNGFLALDEAPIAGAMSGERAAECILEQYEKAMHNPYQRLNEALLSQKYDRVGIQISYGYSKRLDAYAWTGLVYSAQDGQLTNGENCTFQTVVFACSIDAVNGAVYKEDFEGDFILSYDQKIADEEEAFLDESVEMAKRLAPTGKVTGANILWKDHDEAIGVGVTFEDGSGYAFHLNARQGVHQCEYYPDAARMY